MDADAIMALGKFIVAPICGAVVTVAAMFFFLK